MDTEKIMCAYHDVKNKIACILGTVTLLQRKRGQDCELSPLLESIKTCSLAIDDIVNKCREVPTMELAKDLSKVDLHELFEKDGSFYKAALRVCEEVQLELELVNRLSKGCTVLAGPTAHASCEQFFNNVFFNAKKANATRIRIVGVEHDNYVAIHIIDNGDGMTAETLSCLGLSVASKTSTGMGTRIAQKLALMEGAACEWSSPGEGAGTCVTIRITKYKEEI